MTNSGKLIRRGGMFAAMLVASSLPLTANAFTTTYDTSLANPPGVYWGSGNLNEDFVTGVDNAGGIELGLGTVLRFLGPVAPNGNSSIYDVPTGPTSASGKTGTAWGFAFSINADLNGANTTPLSDYTTQLCVLDVGEAHSYCFDPQGLPDNATAASAPTTTLQNSEALQFDNAPTGSLTRYLDTSFDINASDTYVFTLTISLDNELLDSVQMTDVAGTGAVPEPSALALFGVGLLGLARIMRRKKA